MNRHRKRRNWDDVECSTSDELKDVQKRLELIERKAGIVGLPHQRHAEFEMKDALNRLERMERELRAYNRREGRA